MGKDIVTQVQEALIKTKDKHKILKATREKKTTYKRTPITLSVDFSTETLQARGNGMTYYS